LPEVAILLAAHNEEKVIEEKIRTTYDTTYPIHKIQFLIGSDASTDNTDDLIVKYSHQYPQLKFKRFDKKGKIGIVNELYAHSSAPILILTDANVFFQRATLFELVKHFKNKDIGLVGGNIRNELKTNSGISFQESYYQESENRIKENEGLWAGVMMGAFGGCYAVRRECFTVVPKNHLVDDFYVTLKVIEMGKQAIFEKEAVAIEDVSTKITEEFRRKSRISAGNFQNLKTFKSFIRLPITKAGFAFLSHKVLRWLVPFLIIISLITNVALLKYHPFYHLTLGLQVLLLLIPMVDWVLKNININLKLLRFITHFYGMNLALLVGFFNYMKGVKTSVWKPTERNQK
jgi:cellulose synthase/poly-beta-1,6-N-acetylglucosamine synthase-like glycosyltransferase